MTRIPAAERRAALAAAARTVIARDGLAAATTRAIVAEAGMPLASFHYAVASRDELLRDVVELVVADEGTAAADVPRHGDHAARGDQARPHRLPRPRPIRPRQRAGHVRADPVRPPHAPAGRPPGRAVPQLPRPRRRPPRGRGIRPCTSNGASPCPISHDCWSPSPTGSRSPGSPIATTPRPTRAIDHAADAVAGFARQHALAQAVTA